MIMECLRHWEPISQIFCQIFQLTTLRVARELQRLMRVSFFEKKSTSATEFWQVTKETCHLFFAVGGPFVAMAPSRQRSRSLSLHWLSSLLLASLSFFRHFPLFLPFVVDLGKESLLRVLSLLLWRRLCLFTIVLLSSSHDRGARCACPLFSFHCSTTTIPW